jgi:hypothetical protein
MNVLTFKNEGTLLVASNNWQSEMAAAGKLHVSIKCFLLSEMLLLAPIGD